MTAEQKQETKKSTNTEEKRLNRLEDNEFEDFPLDDKWASPQNDYIDYSNLWEEDWGDDNSDDEFSVKLKEELMKAQKN